MQTQFISVKQLRENFPQIRQRLDEGQDFTLVYRSRVLAKIKPVFKKKESKLSKKERIERNVQKVKKLAGGIKLGKKLSQKMTPEFINRLIDKRYEKLLS